MAGEMERLSIVISTMFKDTGTKAASRAVKGLSDEIDSVGDRAQRSASRTRTAYASVAKAMRETRAEAKKGAEFKVSANVSALAGVNRVFRGLRQDADRGATFRARGDASGLRDVQGVFSSVRRDAANGAVFRTRLDSRGLSGVSGAFSRIRQDASNGATFRVRGVLSGFSGMAGVMSSVRADAARDATFRLNADTSGVLSAFPVLNRLDARAREMDNEWGNSIDIHANPDFIAAMARIAFLEQRLEAVDGRTIRINAAVDGAASITELSGKIRALGTVLTVAATPAFISMLAAVPAVASAAAAGVGALAVGIGSGLVGAVAVGGPAILGMVGGVKAYTEVLKSSVSASREAYTALNEDAAKQLEDARNKTLNTQASQALNAEIDDSVLGFARLQAAVGNEAFPYFTRELDYWNEYLSEFTPEIARVGGVIAGVAQQFSIFVRTAQEGRLLGDVFEFINTSAIRGAVILSSFGQAGLLVFQQLIGPAEGLTDSLVGISTATNAWIASSEGTSKIQAGIAYTSQRAGELLGILGDLGMGFVGIGVALEQSGLVDMAMGGLSLMAQNFRDATSSSSGLSGNMERLKPVLQAVVGLAGVVYQEFFRVADAVLAATNPDTGSSTLLELMDSLKAVVPVVGDTLIATFEELAPAISRNIGPISEFVGNFIGSTDVLMGVVDSLGGMAEKFNNLSPAAKDAAAEMASIAAVAAVLGLNGGSLVQTGFYLSMIATNAVTMWPALSAAAAAMWTFVSATVANTASAVANAAAWVWAKGVMIATTVATKAWAAGQWLLNAALTANPIGLLVVGIAALVGGLILAYQHSETFRNIVNTVFASIRDFGIVAFQGLQTAVMTAWTWIATNTPIVWATITAGLMTAWTAISTFFAAGLALLGQIFLAGWTAISLGWTTFWSGLGLIVTTAWTHLTTTLAAGWTFLATLFTTAIATLGLAWTTFWNGLSLAVTTVFTAVSTFVSGWWITLSALFVSGLAVIGRVFSAGWLFLTTTTTAALTAIGTFVSTWWATLSGLFTTGLALVGRTVAAGWTFVSSTTSTVFAAILAFLSGWWASGTALFTSTLQTVGAAVSSGWQFVSSTTSSVFGAIMAFLASWWESGKALFFSGLEAVKGTVGAGWNWVSSTTSSVYGTVASFLAGWWSSATSLFSSSVEAVKSGIGAGWQWVSSTTSSVYDAIASYLGGWWSATQALFSSSLDAVKSGVGSAWDWVSSTTSSVFTAIGSFLGGWWNGTISFFSSSVEAIKSGVGAGWDWLSEKTTSSYTGIRDTVVNLFTDAKDRGLGLVNSLKDGAISAFNALRDATGPIFEAIGGFMVDPVRSAKDALAKIWNGLLDGIAGVLDAVNLKDWAGKVRGAKFAEGGVAGGPARAFAEGGVAGAGVRAFASGGIGTSSPNDRVHVWNEQMGGEVYAAERGPERKQIGYLQHGAAWFDHSVVPNSALRPAARSGREGERPHRRAARPTEASVGYFSIGGLWPNADVVNRNVESKFGVTGSSYDSHPPNGYAGAVDWLVSGSWGTPASGGGLSKGDDIASYLDGNFVNAAIDYLIWNNSWNPGGGWEPYYGSPTISSAPATVAHEDHVHASFLPGVGVSGMDPNAKGSPGGGGGGGFSIPNPLQKLFEAGWNRVVKPLFEAAKGAFPGEYVMSQAGRGAVGMVHDGLYEFVDEKIPDTIGGSGGDPSGGFTGGGDAAANRELGKKMNDARGWGGHWSALDAMWNKESGWDNKADNPTSDAYGIPQGMMGPGGSVPPPGYMPPESDPATQIGWGLNYIADRYGDPSAAWSFHQSNGYYKQGGVVPGSPGTPFPAVLHGQERVLSASNNKAFERLASSITLWSSRGAGGSGGSGLKGGSAATDVLAAKLDRVIERLDAVDKHLGSIGLNRTSHETIERGQERVTKKTMSGPEGVAITQRNNGRIGYKNRLAGVAE